MNERIKIQGFDVDLKTFDEALEYCISGINEQKSIQVVTINPEMIQMAKKNEEQALAIKNAELVVPDGVGIKLALKFKGINQEQIAGVEFSQKLIERAHDNGLKLALLGAKEEVIETLVQKLKNQYPNLNIVFYNSGYFSNCEEIKQKIIEAKPNIFLCAMGMKFQETLNYELKQKLKSCVFVGVGGTFDVLAGFVKRAPKFFQKTGTEWLYRTIKQPERFKRIFPTLPIFLVQSIMDCKRR